MSHHMCIKSTLMWKRFHSLDSFIGFFAIMSFHMLVMINWGYWKTSGKWDYYEIMWCFSTGILLDLMIFLINHHLTEITDTSSLLKCLLWFITWTILILIFYHIYFNKKCSFLNLHVRIYRKSKKPLWCEYFGGGEPHWLFEKNDSELILK